MDFRAYLESEIEKRFEEIAYISRKEETSELPKMYENLLWALVKADVAHKKIIAILVLFGEANNDKVNDEIAEKIYKSYKKD